MKTQKILNISSVDYTGYVYNIELESKEFRDDLYWVEQNSKIVSHNCFPKDMAALVNWAKDNNLYFDICNAAEKVNARLRPEKDWLKIEGVSTKFKRENSDYDVGC